MIKNFIKDALTYIFKDKQILQKSGFLILFMLLVSYSQLFASNLFGKVFINFALLSLFTLVLIFFILGYKVECIKNLISQSELPAFHLKKSFQTGIRYFLAALLFYFPLNYLIFGCGFLGIGFTLTAEHEVGTIIGYVLLFFLVPLILISVLYHYVCLIGLNRIFAETEDFCSFIRFKELFSLIKNNKKMYFTAVGLNCLLELLGALILFGFINLFKAFDIAFLNIIPETIIWLYIFYVGVFVASKFTEYQADQHQ